MNVFVYDPFVSKNVIEKFGGTKVDNLAEAVKQMDAISLHVPLNKETKNLINFEDCINSLFFSKIKFKEFQKEKFF